MPEAGVFSAAEMVQIAIQLEQNGQAFYQAAANRTNHEEVKHLLEFLAKEEERHERVFAGLLPEEKEHRPAQEYPGQKSAFIQALLEERLLPAGELVERVLPGLKSDAEVLDFALGFEKDTIIFFYELRHMLDAAQRGIMDEIMAQEKAHVERLRRLCRACRRAEEE
jgi:rubrerythrin